MESRYNQIARHPNCLTVEEIEPGMILQVVEDSDSKYHRLRPFRALLVLSVPYMGMGGLLYIVGIRSAETEDALLQGALFDQEYDLKHRTAAPEVIPLHILGVEPYENFYHDYNRVERHPCMRIV